jgi:ankyrin repeat protein
MTVLHWACFHDNVAVVKFALDAAANPLQQDNEGRSALHWCSTNKDDKCIKVLSFWVD